MLICVIGLALLFAVMNGTPASLSLVMLALAIFGVGQGLFISPNNSAIMAAAPPSLTGEAGGLLNVMRSLGISIGVAAASSLLAWRLAVLTGSGHNTLAAEGRHLLAAGHDVIILLGGCVTVAGALSLTRTSPRSSRKTATQLE
jgi:MFS family permease